jgi:hypothetical protein
VPSYKDTEIHLRNHTSILLSLFCQVYEPLNYEVYDIYTYVCIYILIGEYIKIMYVSFLNVLMCVLE